MKALNLKIIPTVFLVFGSVMVALAQIVNVESLRKQTDTTGFAGGVLLSGTYLDNARSIYSIDFKPHIQYKWERDLLLLVGDYKITKSENVDYNNASFAHLRYNHEFSDFFRWETFSQVQYNKIAHLNFRLLIGTGSRMKLAGNQYLRIYLGIIPMYQYEEIDDEARSTESNFRFSNYVSFTILLGDRASLYSTSYHQPVMNEWSDYRFFNEQKLKVNLFQNFAVTFQSIYTWDNRPPEGAPARTLEMRTGLQFNF